MKPTDWESEARSPLRYRLVIPEAQINDTCYMFMIKCSLY